MSEDSQLLDQLPDSEESRERVSRWLKQSELRQENDRLSLCTSERGCSNPRIVSLFEKRAGAVPPADPPNQALRKGPTAAHSGSKGQGSTASHSRSRDHDDTGKRPTASCGGSSECSGTSKSSNRGRKRPATSVDTSESDAKRKRRSSSTDSGSDSGQFNPASLVKAKEGTFKPDTKMTRYLDKHLKRCLEKEEREAIFKVHPRPDAKVCTVPLPDKYITDYLGNKFPKEQDAQDKKVQASVLAIVRPLTSAWQSLLESGVETNPGFSIPAIEVLDIIQRTICLVGNSSELISQRRRANILATIDPLWSKFGTDKYTQIKRCFLGRASNRNSRAVWRKKLPWQRLCRSPTDTRNVTAPQGKGGKRAASFFDRALPSSTGMDRAGEQHRTTCHKGTPRGEVMATIKEGLFKGQARNHSSTSPTSHTTKPTTTLIPSIPGVHRRSPRDPSGPSSRKVRGGRGVFRLGVIAERKGKISGRQDSVLLLKLGKDHQRPVDPGGDLRVSPRVFVIATPEKVAKATCVRRGEVRSPRKRARGADSERSSEQGAATRGQLCQPNVPSAKRRRIMETNHRPPGIEPVHHTPSFQDGRNQDTERPDPKERLDGQVGYEDAYLSVPIHPAHQHYLCFQWQGELWKFQSLPFGLRSAPYVFTKILKPVTALLRKLGIRCILYLDDMLIMAQDKKELLSQLSTAMELLILLGFVINTKKSICTPKQTMECLGFEIILKQMSMALPEKKVEEIKRSVRRLKSEKVVTTKQLARLLGLMVAAHPAVLPAPIYYQQLQWEKIKIVRHTP